MNYYLGNDAESGGIGTDKSLLTAYFGVFDNNCRLLDSLSLNLKPNDGIYKVTASGLSVNKIDLVQHDTVAETFKEGGTKLYNFLKKSFDKYGILTPVGQNNYFDIEMYQEHLISRGSWEQYVSYRRIDTMTVARFLQDTGKLPSEMGISLGNLISYFNIPVAGNQHEAEYDTICTMEVYKRLKQLV